MGMGQIDAYGGILLQYHLSHVHWDDTLQRTIGYELLSFIDMVLGDNHAPIARD